MAYLCEEWHQRLINRRSFFPSRLSFIFLFFLNKRKIRVWISICLYEYSSGRFNNKDYDLHLYTIFLLRKNYHTNRNDFLTSVVCNHLLKKRIIVCSSRKEKLSFLRSFCVTVIFQKKKKREKQDILPVIITFFTDSRRRIVIIDNYSKCRNTQIDSSKIDDFSTNSSFSSHRCKIH